MTDKASLTRRYHDASSLLLVIISHAKVIFIHTHGKAAPRLFDFMGLTVVAGPIRGAHTGGAIPSVASDEHQPSLGDRPIKGHFTWFLLVFCTTTTRVERSLEARPIPCISMLEEEAEEACSPFVTCIRIPGWCKSLTWTELKVSSMSRGFKQSGVHRDGRAQQ